LTRLFASLLVTLVLAAAAAGTASAHAALRHAQPAAGEELTTAPTEIRIEFSTGIQLDQAEIHLNDQSGTDLALTRPDGEPDASEMLVRLIPTALAPGTYKVRWRVLSIDGHWTRGDYSFSVNAGGQ
jgi:hypothetical protein